jgi:hypothetical protein
LQEEERFLTTTANVSSKGLSSRLADFSNRLGLAWWVRVTTRTPNCVYYFGPFLNQQEAYGAISGYVEDLEQEQAEGITAVVQRCKPAQLTYEL